MLCELLDSLGTHPESRLWHIGVINVGLEAGQAEWLEDRFVRLVEGQWDIPFAGCQHAPRYKQAFTVTPFLPEYFPGYDVYLWIDSDVWVQDWSAIEMYVRGALRDGMAAVPEIDRNYPSCTSGLGIKLYRNIPFIHGRIKSISTVQYARMSRLYPKWISRQLMFAPVVNAGVFAIARGAPHWAAWQESYRAARIRDHSALSDQAALNHAIYTKKLSLHRLPCSCNWLTCFGPPMLDEKNGTLVEPSLPFAPIGLLHLAGTGKEHFHDIHTLSGNTYRNQLNLAAFRDLRASVVAQGNENLADTV